VFLQILLALWEELVSFIERIKIKNEIAFSRKKEQYHSLSHANQSKLKKKLEL